MIRSLSDAMLRPTLISKSFSMSSEVTNQVSLLVDPSSAHRPNIALLNSTTSQLVVFRKQVAHHKSFAASINATAVAATMPHDTPFW